MGEVDWNTVVPVLIGIVCYAGAMVLASKTKTIGKLGFLIIVLPLTIAPYVDWIVFRDATLSDGALLIRAIFYMAISPAILALAFVFRVRDAGIDKNAAWLGIIPTISLFAAIYLLFQDKAYEPGKPGY